MRSVKLLSAVAFAAFAASASAQTIKIGFITSYSGLNGNLGPYMERAVRLYIKQHQKELPPGVKIELITRDDTGPNPDKAKQLAQELIVRDKVNLLAGVIFTPNALAIAPLATEAKVPFVVMNAGTAVITTKSPYIVRTSFTLWQSSYPLGEWASKKFKTAYTLVSDFGPGHDAEEAFSKAFEAGGGKVIDKLRVPLQNPDWAAYMQRVKDAKPGALMVFIPAGKTATAVAKNFNDLGLKEAGIKLIGPGDITTEEELPNMGDVALGVTTVFHWSLAGDRPANKAFVAAFEKANSGMRPNFMAVGGYDGIALIYQALEKTKGDASGDKLIAAMKGMSWMSPRGPVSIDPETRDIIQPEYLREVRKVNGHLANVELETLSKAEKDPWKELNKKK